VKFSASSKSSKLMETVKIGSTSSRVTGLDARPRVVVTSILSRKNPEVSRFFRQSPEISGNRR